MRKLILFCLLLLIGVFCSACVNSLAVYELNEKAIKLKDEGDIQGAISRWESSVDLDPKVYESRYNLANAYFSIGECEKSLEHAKVAKEINENEPIADYMIAIAYDCSAQNLIEKKDENGEIVPIAFDTKENELDTMKKYKEYLENAKIAYDTYITKVNNTEDKDAILKKIDELNQIIEDTKQKYNL